MKNIFLLILWVFWAQSNLLAGPHEIQEPNLENSSNLIVPHLDDQSMQNVREVSRHLKNTVDQYLQQKVQAPLCLFNIFESNLIQRAFRLSLEQLMQTAIDQHEFFMLRRGHAFQPQVQAYREGRHLDVFHASVFLEKPKFANTYEAMQWEDQIDYLIYFLNRPFNQQALQTNIQKQIKATNDLYIPFDQIHKCQEPSPLSRFLLTAEDFWNDRNPALYNAFFESQPQSTLVIDMNRKKTVVGSGTWSRKIKNWVLTNTKGKGCIKQPFFEHSRHFPEDLRLQLPAYIKDPQRNMLYGMDDLAQGFQVQLPENSVILRSHGFRATHFTKGFRVNFPSNLSIIRNYFFHISTLPENVTFKLPPTTKKIGSDFFGAATLLEGVRVELPENLSMLGSYAFLRAKLHKNCFVSFPDNLAKIRRCVFLGATLHEGCTVRLPQYLQSIGKGFFKEATLEKDCAVELPQNLKRIGDDFFGNATLPLGFILRFPKGLKIGLNFMQEPINLPQGCALIGLDDLIEDLVENQRTLTKDFTIKVKPGPRSWRYIPYENDGF